MTPKQMIRLLESNGFVEVSQNGSHKKFRNHETGNQTMVPFHTKDLTKPLEQEILKQAGLKRRSGEK